MSINIDPVVASRINSAWSQLTPAQRNQLGQAILAANQQAVAVAQTKKAPPEPAAPHHLMFAQSALSNDSDHVVGSLQEGIVLDVGSDGVIWGTGKYEQFDPGWAEALACYLESLLPLVGGKHPFVDAPQIIEIPDSVQVGLVGDWATGDWRTSRNPAPSTDVRTHMKILQPDITIHLGDVYYAGTSDEEQHLLVSLWPGGSRGSFALNSNHEMYSGSKPYFKAIANAPFDQQRGCSYFALQNKSWVIVGLDSAYYSPEATLYLDGKLFPDGNPNAQFAFLQSQVAAARETGKKILLLTHHNGLDDTGTTPNDLYSQVMGAFPEGGGPDYWYWGHLHIGAVYNPMGPANTECRCCGHGGLPWGHAPALSNPKVAWYENRSANDPDVPQRVLNGFAVLYLRGPDIQEVFYDENGGSAWHRP